jgi:flagellar basal body-associated protein FliL
MNPFGNPLKAALMFALILLLLLGLAAGIRRMFENSQQASAEARQARAEGAAVSGSIKDASGAVARSEGQSEAIDTQVRETINEIDQAGSVNDITRIASERVREHRDRAGKPKPLP